MTPSEGGVAASYSGAQSAESQSTHSPDDALALLREGNERFRSGARVDRDLLAQVTATSGGQYPFAVVLGCIDSRVPVEVIFDQGIGDVFTARVAGNVVNGDVLGSMEFACQVAGAKAVVVLGHTACGAVKGALAGAELGHLTGLVQKIEPAVAAVVGDRDRSDPSYVDAVAEANVRLVIDQIRAQSTVLSEMESVGDIAIAGAMYGVGSGEVRWL